MLILMKSARFINYETGADMTEELARKFRYRDRAIKAGSVRGGKKAKASRRNGRKGGRPVSE